MQIPFRLNSNSDEWVLIELQGDLVSHSATDFNGKLIGNLFYTKKGLPVLIIGHHILYGKIVNLEKPLAALVKDICNIDDGKVTYNIKAIIKQKLLFKTRPKPLISSSIKM